MFWSDAGTRCKRGRESGGPTKTNQGPPMRVAYRCHRSYGPALERRSTRARAVQRTNGNEPRATHEGGPTGVTGPTDRLLVTRFTRGRAVRRTAELVEARTHGRPELMDGPNTPLPRQQLPAQLGHPAPDRAIQHPIAKAHDG